jgi:hypothetical protein
MLASFTRWLAVALLLASFAACARDEGTKAGISKAGFIEAISPGAKSPTNVLTLGQVARGALETSDPLLGDSSHYDIWSYQGRRGERIQITLESTDFDAYLMLGREVDGRLDSLGRDDDGGGDSNARITIELPADGGYIVLANSFRPRQLGAYTLRVESQPAPAQTTAAGGIDWAARYPGGGDPKGRYALVVGIDDYRGIATSLPGAAADPRLIGRILVERYGFRPENVIAITDRDATRDHITQAFLRHLGQAGSDGLAVFYFSGHGVKANGNLGLTGDLDPEADGVDEALYVWGSDGRGSLILDDELGFLADRLQSDRVLFIIDACFSGTGTRGGTAGQPKEVQFEDVRNTLTMPKTFLTDGARTAARPGARKGISDLMREPQRHLLLAASADDQLSWTGGGWPKYGRNISVFTYYLSDALEAAPENATFTQLMGPVRDQTDAHTQRENNARQTPQTEGRQASARIREFLRQR